MIKPFLLKNIEIKYLFLLTILLVNIICTAFYIIDIYTTDEENIIKEIDDKLITVAYGSKFLTDNYHDKITDKSSISNKEYMQVVNKLTNFSRKTKVEYVYTMILYKGEIVFTSDTISEKRDKYAKFFQDYTDATKALIEAGKDKKIHYAEYRDSWGKHRSVFFPTKSVQGKEYIIGVDISLDFLNQKINNLLFKTILIGFSVFIISSILIIFIVILLVKPLKYLVKAAEVIGTGNLEVKLPDVKLGYEIGKLTETFRYMQTSLKEYINKLTETTAANERIESELRIAHDIQMNIIPKTFPPFPDREEFDIYAVMKPARQVGGDFYDFFFIDDEHFCFVIADVSDKGVPASLFMAVTKTLIKAKASNDLTAGEILTKVNYELSQDNDSCMFVTAFLGILNTRTGDVSFSNAGHNPPLIIKYGNEVEFLNPQTNFVIGAMMEVEYKTESLILAPGDVLFMYTDGVTEAMNSQLDLFSDNRLKEELIKSNGKTNQDIISDVMQSIETFADNAIQSDDITIMAMKFMGAKNY